MRGRRERATAGSLEPSSGQGAPNADGCPVTETTQAGRETLSKDPGVRLMFIVVLLLVLWATFKVLAPFAAGFTWAAVLVATFRPFHDYLMRVFNGRRWAASTLVTISGGGIRSGADRYRGGSGGRGRYRGLSVGRRELPDQRHRPRAFREMAVAGRSRDNAPRTSWAWRTSTSMPPRSRGQKIGGILAAKGRPWQGESLA
jgi:hypothetical protein